MVGGRIGCRLGVIVVVVDPRHDLVGGQIGDGVLGDEGEVVLGKLLVDRFDVGIVLLEVAQIYQRSGLVLVYKLAQYATVIMKSSPGSTGRAERKSYGSSYQKRNARKRKGDVQG